MRNAGRKQLTTRSRMTKRVSALVHDLTVEEKIAQMSGVWGKSVLSSNQFDPTLAKQVMPLGCGHITRNSLHKSPGQAARDANKIQQWLVSNTRHGIPAIIHEESLAGLMAKGAMTFPMPIGLAASFDDKLIERVAQIIREQMLAVGARQSLAPVLDIARDHRWGRCEETFGEDPYLTARCGVSYIKGLQGNDLEHGVAATAKHFVGYGASEGGLNWAPSSLGAREMGDVYLHPFAVAVSEVGIASVMNAYQEIDGVPCGASEEILTTILRQQLGFDGVVVSDYDTVPSLVDYHKLAPDRATAAALALRAGIDLELPTGEVFSQYLPHALADGTVSIEMIDQAVGRILQLKERLGLFDQPFVDESKVDACFNRPQHSEISLESARKSIVLLRNEANILPIKDRSKRIAVIGTAADSKRLLQGDYHYPAFYEFQFGGIPDRPGDDTRITGPSAVSAVAGMVTTDDKPSRSRVEQIPDLQSGLPESRTVLDAIVHHGEAFADVAYSWGCHVTDSSESGFQHALETASQSDVVVIVLGGRSGLARDCTDGEFNDRAELRLPGVQQKLLEEVCKLDCETVLVLLNGRPLDLSWASCNVAAIIEAWLPGEQGGNAIADILFGNISPSGKLPFSLSRGVGQMPIYYNHKPSGRQSFLYGDYGDLPASPLYPFGFGLSYTDFEFTNLVCPSETNTTNDTINLSWQVANIGEYDGDEVVQLYVRQIDSDITRPVKELKGFARVSIKRGQSVKVICKVPLSALAFHGLDGTNGVQPGRIEIQIGSSSEDIRLTKMLRIAGDKVDVALGAVLPTSFEIDPS